MDVGAKKIIPTTPLSFMEKLSSNVYIYRPKVPSTTVNSDPKVIALFGWTAARDTHLSKYIEKYREIFPTSAIVVVKAGVSSQRHPSVGRRHVQPAVAPVRELLNSSADKPELLLHVMSNGGSAMLNAFYDMYAESGTDDNDRVLPLHVTIIDSAPGKGWEYNMIVNAITPGFKPGLQRLVALPFVHFLAMWRMGGIHFLGNIDDMAEARKSHNDKSRVRELRRVYCYGDKDIIVPMVDVDNHAAEAVAKGFEVRKEFFKGSAHVSHMKSDPKRYWGIVEEAWRDKARL